MLRGRRLPRRRRLLLARHRRLLAAVLLAVATGLAVDAVAAGPPPGSALLVAARDLPAGHDVAAADVTTVQVPAGALPDGALTADDTVGATLAAPLRRGEPVTDARVAGPGLLVGAAPGTLALPVPVVGPPPASLVRAGDRVSVLAGSRADDLGVDGGNRGEVLVPSAVVLAVPRSRADGLLDGATAEDVVVLALDRPGAIRVAAAAGQRPLMVAVLP